MNYQNHFADHSENYLDFRPTYPEDLFNFLSSIVNNHDLVWDCGTGNGQAAVALASRFKQVVATDLNQEQLNMAPKLANISYYCARAEKTLLDNTSVDLITVAQALHWFNLDQFYSEVRRVLRPDGIIAAWCYALGSLTPDLDQVIKNLYESLPWPPERQYIDQHYQNIPFPFDKISTPQFFTQKIYTLDHLIGYLKTWSAVKEHQKKTNENPVDLILPGLQTAWGDPAKTHAMKWPIYLLIGTLPQ